jgi:hypothetical membrane protein
MAGAMLFVAGAIALKGIITAETLYPGYSTSDDKVSDLGSTEPPNGIIVQPSSNIFSASMFICGALVLIAPFMFQQAIHRKIETVPLAIFGLGVLGVELFYGSWGGIRATFAMMAFMGGGTSTIVSFKVLVGPHRYISVGYSGSQPSWCSLVTSSWGRAALSPSSAWSARSSIR